MNENKKKSQKQNIETRELFGIAQRNYESVLEILCLLYGRYHRESVILRLNLANCYAYQGKAEITF